MPALFNKLGVSFTYPDNWTLDQSEALGGNRSVTVYSPEESFWSVYVHPPGMLPAVLVTAAVKALRETYPESDVEAVVEEADEFELVGADVNFYCLDMTNTATIRSFVAPHCVCLVLTQVDDRDLPALEPVFRAMTLSLIRGFDFAAGIDPANFIFTRPGDIETAGDVLDMPGVTNFSDDEDEDDDELPPRPPR